MKLTKLYFWFAISATFCLVVLAVTAMKYSSREWEKYQRDFYVFEASNIANPDIEKAILRTPLEIKQIIVKELDRVDRCTTCHISIDNPLYAEKVDPLKSHPGDFLVQHDIEKFGCTICHEGQGRATTVSAAHGETKWWDMPLLPTDYVYGTCGKCHTEAQVPNPLFGQGQRLLRELGCKGCHIIDGEGGTVGPELDGVGSRHKADWLFNHFKNPESSTPGSVMPKFDLSDDEIRSLVMLMYGFGQEEIPLQFRAFKESSKLEKTAPITDKVQAGKTIFEKYGCAGCHGRAGQGNVRNPNAPGNLVPSIIYVAEGYTKDELKEYILKGAISKKENPELSDPPLFMPSWKGKISESELENLVVYLMSLYPEDEEIWQPSSYPK